MFPYANYDVCCLFIFWMPGQIRTRCLYHLILIWIWVLLLRVTFLLHRKLLFVEACLISCWSSHFLFRWSIIEFSSPTSFGTQSLVLHHCVRCLFPTLQDAEAWNNVSCCGSLDASHRTKTSRVEFGIAHKMEVRLVCGTNGREMRRMCVRACACACAYACAFDGLCVTDVICGIVIPWRCMMAVDVFQAALFWLFLLQMGSGDALYGYAWSRLHARSSSLVDNHFECNGPSNSGKADEEYHGFAFILLCFHSVITLMAVSCISLLTLWTSGSFLFFILPDLQVVIQTLRSSLFQGLTQGVAQSTSSLLRGLGPFVSGGVFTGGDLKASGLHYTSPFPFDQFFSPFLIFSFSFF